MNRDTERIDRICAALREEALDALICALPMNVLMLTGYWPVIGASIAVVTREGALALVAPDDEKDLAERGWADTVRFFSPMSLDKVQSATDTIRGPLADAIKALKLGGRPRIGWEAGPTLVPGSYVSIRVYGAAMGELLAAALPGARLQPAADLLGRLRSILTPGELERVRLACRIAGAAFREGSKIARAGMTESRAANIFRAFLSSDDLWRKKIQRRDGSVWCMSGPNSARAYAAYQLSSSREIAPGDLALVHCNSCADGFWTDITRTFCVGEPDRRKQRMYAAIFAASQAALQAIRPGARARDVDRAAREVLAEQGFAREFKHPTGHGAGLVAIDHNARPRLHPASDDILEPGMVFNVEPGIYVEGFGGARQCDMVAVTDTGGELLTAFLRDDTSELMLPSKP